MPAATNTFQQIAGSEPGPFTQFLRPHIPLNYGVLPEGQTAATGYEGNITGAGKLALGFLQGVRQQRLAKAQEDDANVQTGLDNFQKHVDKTITTNSDLTDEGKQILGSKADEIMNQHMHYEIRDVPKDGVAGFFKNLLTHATGGPIKVREPIDWNQAIGMLTTEMKPEYSQLYNYNDITKRGQQAVAEYERKVIASGRPMTKEDYDYAWDPFYREALSKAKDYAPYILAASGQGAPAAGSMGDMFQRFIKARPPGATVPPATAAPPPRPPVSEPSSPMFYTPKPIAGYDLSVPQGGAAYKALHPGTQHPINPNMIPLPDWLKGPLAGPPPTATPEELAELYRQMYGTLPPGPQSPVVLNPGSFVRGADGRPVQVRSTGVNPQ